MRKAVAWLTKQSHTRIDAVSMFGLGYLFGAPGAFGTWWGKALVIAAGMGVTDMLATGLRRLAGWRP
jgi:hypothetical protein